MEAKFFQTYKRRFFIGLGVLLALTCLALAYYNRMLGIFGLVTSITGLYAFHYVDRQEKSARERQLKEELLAVEKEMPPEELPAASDLSLVFIQVDDYDEVFQGLPETSGLYWWLQLINSCGNGQLRSRPICTKMAGPLFNASSYR